MELQNEVYGKHKFITEQYTIYSSVQNDRDKNFVITRMLKNICNFKPYGPSE